ncbi:hypothetical protein CERSUDRAFT_145912 [Gelatoporia subvermispora B]|uniref:Uncharacterized protein n=1 Tax=Ceriporiopsis subvermispora (strain B) TaxID=914234 RepID=M2QET5_CERS8|nr:hypothetical protein CERSUDRAFT_145912 [Gelatoporia subvermispora B]
MAAEGPDTPASFHEAIRSRYADEWWTAMREEIGMLERRKTWVLTVLPPGRKAFDLMRCAQSSTLRLHAAGTAHKTTSLAPSFTANWITRSTCDSPLALRTAPIALYNYYAASTDSSKQHDSGIVT